MIFTDLWDQPEDDHGPLKGPPRQGNLLHCRLISKYSLLSIGPRVFVVKKFDFYLLKTNKDCHRSSESKSKLVWQLMTRKLEKNHLMQLFCSVFTIFV